MKTDRPLWICVVMLTIVVVFFAFRIAFLENTIRGMNDGIEAIRYNDGEDAIKLIRRDREVSRLEDRIKKLESRLGGRKTGDAPPAGDASP